MIWARENILRWRGTRSSSRTWRVFLITIVAFAGIGPLDAQIDTGGFTGDVIDERGEALPGVRVTARNTETGLERAVSTVKSGRYFLLALPPGPYEISLSYPGYAAEPVETVVDVGQKVPVDFAMKPEREFVERVTVTAEPPLVNTTKSELATVVTPEQIRDYPLLDREFTDLALLAPGVRAAPVGRGLGGNERTFTTGGTTGSDLNLSVDGVDNTETVFGAVQAGLPLDGIAEFEIIQDQYKAEYGRAAGAVVNVITKSGTNDLGGSVFGTYRNENLRTPSFDERLGNSEKVETDKGKYGFSVGGPIVQDRLFYFLAAERQDERNPVTLSPSITDFAGTEPAGFPIAIPLPGTVVTNDIKRDLWTVKLNWNPTTDHLLWLRYTRDEMTSTNVTLESPRKISPNQDPTSATDYSLDSLNLAASWQWLIRDTLVNELRGMYADHEVSYVPSDFQGVGLNFSGFGLGVTAPATFTSKNYQLRDDLTWLRGRHSLKTGLDILGVDHESIWFKDGLPIISFNSGITPAETMAMGQASGLPGTDSNNGVDDGIDVINNVQFLNAFRQPMDSTHIGAYFQDDWQIGNRWTVHMGLRYDKEQNLWEAGDEPLKSFYECLADPGDNLKCGRDPATVNPPKGVPDFQNTLPEDPEFISPRLGFVYRVGKENRDLIRGSWGLFAEQPIGNFAIFNEANLCDDCYPIPPVLFGCDPTDLGGCAGRTNMTAGTSPGPGIAPLPVDFTLNNLVNDPSLNGWIKSFTANSRHANFTDVTGRPLASPDFTTPYKSSFSIGWAHLFNDNLSLDTNFVYRRGFHQVRQSWLAGLNSGREAPWPAVTDPNTGAATYPGILLLFVTDGKSEDKSLQFSFKGRYPRFDFAFNLNLSEFLGTQDTAVNPLADGGNIQFTGGNIDSEWGRLTGSQAIYALLHGLWRLPRGFSVAGQMGYGSRLAVHARATGSLNASVSGVDLNGDGWIINEYAGARGGALGGDYFDIDLRISKTFQTGAGTSVEGYLDVFNVTNHDNWGAFIQGTQFVVVNGQIRSNSAYPEPTGQTLTPPRWFQLGTRFTF